MFALSWCEYELLEGAERNKVLILLYLILCICRVEVMEQLIQSSDLFVMQVEMDVYTALKKVETNAQKTLTLRLNTPVSIECVDFLGLFASAVDVSAAQPVMGRPNQAASG